MLDLVRNEYEQTNEEEAGSINRGNYMKSIEPGAGMGASDVITSE
jgi:hypothetical protein